MRDPADLAARETGLGRPCIAESEVRGAPADVDLGIRGQELDADAVLDLPDLTDVRREERLQMQASYDLAQALKTASSIRVKRYKAKAA